MVRSSERLRVWKWTVIELEYSTEDGNILKSCRCSKEKVVRLRAEISNFQIKFLDVLELFSNVFENIFFY